MNVVWAIRGAPQSYEINVDHHSIVKTCSLSSCQCFVLTAPWDFHLSDKISYYFCALPLLLLYLEVEGKVGALSLLTLQLWTTERRTKRLTPTNDAIFPLNHHFGWWIVKVWNQHCVRYVHVLDLISLIRCSTTCSRGCVYLWSVTAVYLQH